MSVWVAMASLLLFWAMSTIRRLPNETANLRTGLMRSHLLVYIIYLLFDANIARVTSFTCSNFLIMCTFFALPSLLKGVFLFWYDFNYLILSSLTLECCIAGGEKWDICHAARSNPGFIHGVSWNHRGKVHRLFGYRWGNLLVTPLILYLLLTFSLYGVLECNFPICSLFHLRSTRIFTQKSLYISLIAILSMIISK